MTLRPRDLPKIRAQMLRQLDDPTTQVRARTGEENAAGLDSLASHLRVGGLYWVTADMAALAMSAGAQLAAVRWTQADRPEPCGLIMFDGGLGMVHAQGVDLPVDALSWGPHDGELMVWMLLSRRRLATELALRAGQGRGGIQPVEERLPPMIPIGGDLLPVTAEPLPLAGASEMMRPVLGALAAAWLLMQQPTLATRDKEQAPRDVRQMYARQDLPDPDVTIIDLRRQFVPPDADRDGEGSQYRHRWVVSGHWRDQPYGPERALRRQQWIPAYVKGPDGAPLLATERVNVWRR